MLNYQRIYLLTMVIFHSSLYVYWKVIDVRPFHGSKNTIFQSLGIGGSDFFSRTHFFWPLGVDHSFTARLQMNINMNPSYINMNPNYINMSMVQLRWLHQH